MKLLKKRFCFFGRPLIAIALMLMSGYTTRADYQGTVLSDSPLAYYPLNLNVDTGSTATDLSGNGNSGTYVNISSGVNNAAGPSTYIPNAVSFDGVSTYVDLSTGGNPAQLNFGGPITLEAWVQPTNPNQNLWDITGKGYDSANNYDEVTLRLNGGKYEGVLITAQPDHEEPAAERPRQVGRTSCQLLMARIGGCMSTAS